MMFSFHFIAGFMIGIEFVAEDEDGGAAFVLDIGVVRIIVQRFVWDDVP